MERSEIRGILSIAPGLRFSLHPGYLLSLESTAKPRKQSANENLLSEAKAQLSKLVRRAEAGDEVILTRQGRSVVRLVPVKPALDTKVRRAVLDAARISGTARVKAGPSAARSQDFLYDITSKPPGTIELE